MFEQDGFILLKKAFSAKRIAEMSKAYNRQLKIARQKKTLTQIGKGRFDFELTGKVFEKRDPKAILDIVKTLQGKSLIRYVGGLPSLPGSKNGDWHRDIYSLFRNEAVNLVLPNFYLTILVALDDISLEDGPTEIYVGGKIIMQSGDALVLSQNTIHRGTANKSDKEKRLIYIVYCPKWYNDYL